MSKIKKKEIEKVLRESSKPIENKERIVLPPYGFADEILKAKEELQEKKDDTMRSEAIYTFADRLKEKQKSETVRKDEDIYETWVIFTLADELYALPVLHVQEILRAESITRVPDAPHPVRGITNMRGSVLPVVDLRVRLGLKKAGLEASSRILVVDSRKRLIGLLIDSVQEVKKIAMNKIQPPPEDIMTNKSDYIIGVYQLADNLIILLDVHRVLLIHDTSFKESDLSKQTKDLIRKDKNHKGGNING